METLTTPVSNITRELRAKIEDVQNAFQDASITLDLQYAVARMEELDELIRLSMRRDVGAATVDDIHWIKRAQAVYLKADALIGKIEDQLDAFNFDLV